MTIFREGHVSGFLHQPEGIDDRAPVERSLVLTHGAGGNCKAPLLVLLADAFCAAGYRVLRCDMAFRQRKAFGPPSPATGGDDRASLREAVAAMRKIGGGKVMLGGHSYGGRQATMLASETPGLVEGLLLMSYPLHPPGKPDRPRTAHLPALRTPSLFLQGTRDPFGTIEEMRTALQMIPAKTELITVEGAGHDLNRDKFKLVEAVIATLNSLCSDPGPTARPSA
ncbi:MAG TPA: alpha/beta fold hydrolase [Bryobacteraceae bacterium]|nr:alpha/beta fold hydrolase [Bryobacteraceae bacterium]